MTTDKISKFSTPLMLFGILRCSSSYMDTWHTASWCQYCHWLDTSQKLHMTGVSEKIKLKPD